MKTIVIICGPTAVGKTKVSIELAKKFNGEIVSADSMQIYKHFDIGSAKPTAQEMQGIKHYMIGEIDPKLDFSVAEYSHMAKAYIEDIFSKGKLPIIVGGTGLYINSLIYDMDFSNAICDLKYRKELEAIYNEHGAEYLHSMLNEVDVIAANRIHANNVKRVIRALEINKLTGKNMADFSTEPKWTSDYNVVLIGLTRQRMKLYVDINRRVDIMMDNGLLDEVKDLVDMGLDYSFISMKGIGYKEVLPYLDDKYSYEDMVSTIKKNSRNYAKRQLTWFRRYGEKIKWFDYDKLGSFDKYLYEIEKFIKDTLDN